MKNNYNYVNPYCSYNNSLSIISGLEIFMES